MLNGDWVDQVMSIIACYPSNELFDFIDVWDSVEREGFSEGHAREEMRFVFSRAIKTGLVSHTSLVRDRPEMTTRLWRRGAL